VGEQIFHSKGIDTVEFSPDGRWLATGGYDCTARIWDARNGKPVRSLAHGGVVESVAFDPSGTLLLTGSRDGTAQLWNVPWGDPAAEPLRHANRVTGMTFDRSGRLALVAASDGFVHVWDVRTGIKLGWPASLGNSWASTPVVKSDNSSFYAAGFGPIREFALPTATNESCQDLEAWCQAVTGLTIDDRGRIKPQDVHSRQRKAAK